MERFIRLSHRFMHQASLTKEIGDLKKAYGDLYLLVVEKLENFNKTVIDNAL